MCMKCGEEWALGDERSCKCSLKTEAMTREDVIQMARQAELLLDTDTIFPYAEGTDIGPMLEKFAALVAAAEREECKEWIATWVEDWCEGWSAKKIAHCIRGDGNDIEKPT